MGQDPKNPSEEAPTDTILQLIIVIFLHCLHLQAGSEEKEANRSSKETRPGLLVVKGSKLVRRRRGG